MPVNMAAVEIDSGAERVHIRLVGDVADGAGHGTGAEGRALGAVQHFDALDVVEMQVRLGAGHAHRHVVDEKSRRGGVRVVRVAAVGDTAHHEKLGARAFADEGNGGHLLCVVVEPGNAEVLHVLLGEDVDAQGNVLKVLLTLAGGDDDFRQHRVIRGARRLSVRRRDSECGGYGETDLGDGGGSPKRRARLREICVNTLAAP